MIRQSKNDLNAVLLAKGVTDPTKKQHKLDQVKEEHHAIVFLYKADKQKYGNRSNKWRAKSC